MPRWSRGANFAAPWQLFRHPGYVARGISLIKGLDPDSAAAQKLLTVSDRLMAQRHPALASHQLESAEALKQPKVLFLGVWVGSELAGCGAVKRSPAAADGSGAYGETKRIYLRQALRGRGLVELLMQRLAQDQVERAISLARFEAGIHQPKTLVLSARLGYQRCGAFGDYQADETGVLMAKRLSG